MAKMVGSFKPRLVATRIIGGPPTSKATKPSTGGTRATAGALGGHAHKGHPRGLINKAGR